MAQEPDYSNAGNLLKNADKDKAAKIAKVFGGGSEEKPSGMDAMKRRLGSE